MTRLENPESGITIEGTFTLGWMGRLSREQLDFVGLLLINRGNVQKLAGVLGLSYNTTRSRLDEIVAALGVPPEPIDNEARSLALKRLAAREITVEEAIQLVRGR